MRGLVATLKLDVTRQARSGLYAVGVFVAIISGLVGRFLVPEAYVGQALALVYLLSLSSTTYIFGASLLLADRTEGTLLALRASPLTADAYLASKAITLTTFSLVEAGIIYGIGFWGAPVRLLPLAAGVVAMGLFYSLLGLGQVVRHASVFSFLVPGAALVGAISQWPFLYVIGVGPPELYYLIPSMGPLLLMLACVEELSPLQWAYASAMSLGSVALVAPWARRQFRDHVGLSLS